MKFSAYSIITMSSLLFFLFVTLEHSFGQNRQCTPGQTEEIGSVPDTSRRNIVCLGGLPFQYKFIYYRKCGSNGRWESRLFRTMRSHPVIIGNCCNLREIRKTNIGVPYRRLRCVNFKRFTFRQYQKKKVEKCVNYNWKDMGTVEEEVTSNASLMNTSTGSSGSCDVCRRCKNEVGCIPFNGDRCDVPCLENDRCSEGSCIGDEPLSPIDPSCQ